MRFVAIIAVLFAFVGAAGQTAPAFEAASVKPSRGIPFPCEEPASESDPAVHSRLPMRISGGPGWFESALFDVVAKLPRDTSKDRVKPMLEGLLADRFSVAFHREMRDYPVYALVSAKDRAKLKASDKDETVSIKTSHDTSKYTTLISKLSRGI